MNGKAIERPIIRRRLLGIGVGAGVTLLVGCGSGGKTATDWTFIDDRTRTMDDLAETMAGWRTVI